MTVRVLSVVITGRHGRRPTPTSSDFGPERALLFFERHAMRAHENMQTAYGVRPSVGGSRDSGSGASHSTCLHLIHFTLRHDHLHMRYDDRE